MIKIALPDDLTIKITTLRGDTQVYDIVQNRYKGKVWTYITITENNVFLENAEETFPIAVDAMLVQISVKDIKRRVYELTNNPDVLLFGANAIKEGEEREILAKLIS